MENEVSGIAKLGIVLIALAVLIGLGFGIFQISKSVANDGVSDVTDELDSVATSQFSSYDQTIITGTMVSSSINDFEGESVSILIANQAWKDVLGNAQAEVGEYDVLLENGAGLSGVYAEAGATSGIQIPVVWAYQDADFSKEYTMSNSLNEYRHGSFVNYNALIGAKPADAANLPTGTVDQDANINGTGIKMAGIYFDNNCWKCSSGYATDDNGKVLFNNITGNLSKSGRTEYIPSGAKFESYLIKDMSGTIMGIAFEQIGN